MSASWPGVVRAADLIGRWAAPAATLVVLLTAAAVKPAFFQASNLTNILSGAAILGIVAIGQTLVLLVRGLDLSVSAVIAVTAVVVVESGAGSSTVVSLLEAVVIAAAIGLTNGFLVAKRKVPPFIATFGMLVFVAGVRLAYTHGQASGNVPEWMRFLGVGQVGFVPWASVLWVGISALVGGVLLYTRYGRWVYAVGGNPEAAAYAGVPVDRVVITCYVACSLLALLAGLVLSGYIGYVDLRLGSDLDLISLAAAIIGGTPFTGGRGNMAGTAAGVLLLTVLLNLVVVAGLQIHWQFAMQGLVLIGAAVIQGVRSHLLTR